MPGAIAAIDVGLLYDQHIDWLRASLCRRTRCPHRAADLAHDMYCRLIEKSTELRIETPRTFLATMARRLLIDDIRRRDVERAILEAQALHATNGEEVTPDRIMEAAQFLDTILRVLDRLPDQARETFLLRRIEGLAQSEIAERPPVPRNAASLQSLKPERSGRSGLPMGTASETAAAFPLG